MKPMIVRKTQSTETNITIDEILDIWSKQFEGIGAISFHDKIICQTHMLEQFYTAINRTPEMFLRKWDQFRLFLTDKKCIERTKSAFWNTISIETDLIDPRKRTNQIFRKWSLKYPSHHTRKSPCPKEEKEWVSEPIVVDKRKKRNTTHGLIIPWKSRNQSNHALGIQALRSIFFS